MENPYASLILSTNAFIHLGMLFYILAFLTRDEFKLRLLIVIGSSFYIAYYLQAAGRTLWPPVISNSLALAINATLLAVILRERTSIGMKGETLEIYRMLPTLKPGQFRRIMSRGDIVTAKEDTTLCVAGQRPSHLYLVVRGNVQVERGAQKFWVGPGNFIGEIAFLLDGAATATVVAPPGTRYVAWRRSTLKALLDQRPALSNAVSALLNTDLARKLARSAPEDVPAE